MIRNNKTVLFIGLLVLTLGCSSKDKSQCTCLFQSKKVNEISNRIWSGSATHQDTLELKSALLKKEKSCKSLQQSSPKEIQELKKLCQP